MKATENDQNLSNLLHGFIVRGEQALRTQEARGLIRRVLESVPTPQETWQGVADITKRMMELFEYINHHEFATIVHKMSSTIAEDRDLVMLQRILDRAEQRRDELSRFNQKTQDPIAEDNNKLSWYDQHKSMTTYSGADIVATIMMPGEGPVVIGELKEIMFSVNREKFPVRSLGRINMKGYTRGMRTITGMLEFVVFDEAIVYRCVEKLKDQGHHLLMDELPLFDISITMANEFGSRSSFSIYGVSTFTESGGFSDQIEGTYSMHEFFALDIDPIERLERRTQTVRFTG